MDKIGNEVEGLKTNTKKSLEKVEENKNNLENLYKEIITFESENTNLVEINKSLGKAKEDLKWLAPGSVGYNKKQEEIDKLEKQAEACNKLRDELRKKCHELNDQANADLDSVRNYNGAIRSEHDKTIEQSKAIAKNKLIEDIKNGNITSENLDDKIKELEESNKDNYFHNVKGPLYDYEKAKDEYWECWRAVVKATDAFRDSRAQLYDWNFAYQASSIGGTVERFDKEFTSQLANMEKLSKNLTEKEEIYKEALAKYEQDEAYIDSLKESKELIQSIENNKERIEELKKALDQANKEKEKIQEEIKTAEAKTLEKQKELEANEKTEQIAKKELEESKKTLEKVNASKKEADQKVKELEEKISELEKNPSDANINQKIKEAKERYEKAKEELRQNREKVKEAKEKEAQCKKKLDEANKAKEEAQKDLEEAQKKLLMLKIHYQKKSKFS